MKICVPWFFPPCPLRDGPLVLSLLRGTGPESQRWPVTWLGSICNMVSCRVCIYIYVYML